MEGGAEGGAAGAEPTPALGASALVIAVHGCNEVNRDTIELARRHGAAWLVLPCCLRAEHYVPGTALKLPDDMRYTFLCGAMAQAYQAELIASIDRRISPRAIVIASALATRGGDGPPKT